MSLNVVHVSNTSSHRVEQAESFSKVLSQLEFWAPRGFRWNICANSSVTSNKQIPSPQLLIQKYILFIKTESCEHLPDQFLYGRKFSSRCNI